MDKRCLLHLTGVLVLAALLTAGVALAQGTGPRGPAAAVGTSFTYQGRLLEGGSPADGTYDFQFALYDVDSEGTPIATRAVNDVTVTDGTFTVQLDFGDVFDGTALWLEVGVRPGSSDGSYTTLSPRQPLTAAPYALSLRPGATISGTIAGGATLTVVNGGGGYGMYASGGAGDVRLGGTGTIYADETSSSDIELHSNDNVDVHLDDDDSNPGKVSSRFRVLNASDTAVFTVTETGAVSWYPQTARIVVPAAAFTPGEDGYDYTNYGGNLIPGNNTSDTYYAPVYLPQGATVTRMIFYWYDDSTVNDGMASLRRAPLTTGSPSHTMAQVYSDGSSGDGSSETTSINYATVDNTTYMYFLMWDLGAGNVGHAVVIEYTYTGPH